MRIGPLTLGYPVGPFDAAANPSHRTACGCLLSVTTYTLPLSWFVFNT